jgi:hypothetical protein
MKAGWGNGTMTRCVLLRLLAGISTGAYCLLPAAAEEAAKPSIIVVTDQRELDDKFCKADVTAEHIVVLPAALFVDSEELICPNGPYKLYRILEHNDPDDFEYYVDPPFGAEARLGCDGKAGRRMKTVAVNCRPE